MIKKLALILICVFMTTTVEAVRKPTCFFITRKLSEEVAGPPHIIPAVYDDEDNIIEPEIVRETRMTRYYPKIRVLYESERGYDGWISAKQTDNYYIVQVFADTIVHRNVVRNMTNADGIYLGATVAQARNTIANNPALRDLITEVNVNEGTIR